MESEVNHQDLISRLGLQGLDEDLRKQLIEQVTQLVQTRFSLRISEQLTESQLNELDQLTGSGMIDEAEARVRSMVPNYNELLKHVTEEVIDELSNYKNYFNQRIGRTS